MSYFLKREYDYTPGVNYGPGGSTGEVAFPTHMEEVHQDWLGYSGSPTTVTTDMISVMESALTTNPLDNLDYADPATDIAALDTEYGEFETMVEALDDQADWQAIVDTAVAKIDSAGTLEEIDFSTMITDALTSTDNSLQKAVEKALAMVDSQVIVKAITEFKRNRQKQREETKAQYKAGMANINAERSSAYALGLALMEIDFEREIGQFQSDMSRQMYQQGIQYYAQVLSFQIEGRLRAELANTKTRNSMVQNSIQALLQYKQFTVEMKKILSQVLAEVNRVNFVMDSEYVANTADLNWKHSSWDMNVYKNGVTVLGGIGGGQFVPEGPSKTQSAIGGAMQGIALAGTVSSGLSAAGAGAAAGAVGGPVGIAVGAGLGIAAGLFA